MIRQTEGLSSRFDWPLFIAAALIALIGVVNLYSATSVYQGGIADADDRARTGSRCARFFTLD